MTRPVDFRPEAVDEVDAAYEWYEEQRAGLGEEFLATLVSRLDEIQASPEGWAILYRGIRACPMRRFPYIIYFRVMPDRINVVAVHHGHRSPRAWRSRA